MNKQYCNKCRKLTDSNSGFDCIECGLSRTNEVDHPQHYQGKIEVIDVIESFNLSFSEGNVLKYLLRAGKKDSKLVDLRKAKWYIDRMITNEEHDDRNTK